MCVVSMVGDDWTRRLPGQHPWIDDIREWPYPSQPSPIPNTNYPEVSREEFDKLKKDVEEMKKQLEKAKAQDIADGAPDCEMEEKVALLKKIAELVGVDLSTVWPQDK